MTRPSSLRTSRLALDHLRSGPGTSILVAALVAITVLVVALAPRALAQLSTDELRYSLNELSPLRRDLGASGVFGFPNPTASAPTTAEQLFGSTRDLLDRVSDDLEAPLSELMGEPQWVVRTGGRTAERTDGVEALVRPVISVAVDLEWADRVELVDGAPPAPWDGDESDQTDPNARPPIEIALSEETAENAGLAVGDVLSFVPREPPGRRDLSPPRSCRRLLGARPRPEGRRALPLVGGWNPALRGRLRRSRDRGRHARGASRPASSPPGIRSTGRPSSSVTPRTAGSDAQADGSRPYPPERRGPRLHLRTGGCRRQRHRADDARGLAARPRRIRTDRRRARGFRARRALRDRSAPGGALAALGPRGERTPGPGAHAHRGARSSPSRRARSGCSPRPCSFPVRSARRRIVLADAARP